MRHLAGRRRQLQAGHTREVAGERQRQQIHLQLHGGREIRRRRLITRGHRPRRHTRGRLGCRGRDLLVEIVPPLLQRLQLLAVHRAETRLHRGSSLLSMGNSFCRMKAFLSGPDMVDIAGGKNVMRASAGSSCGSMKAPAVL